MTNATTPANGEAMPKPDLPRGDLEHRIDMDALAKLDMQQIRAMRDGLRVINEVACGMLGQPRFCGDGAGDLLEGLIEWIATYEAAVVNVAIAARPATERDAEEQQWCILSYHAAMADCLDEFAVMAASAVRAESKARFKEKHAKRTMGAVQ